MDDSQFVIVKKAEPLSLVVVGRPRVGKTALVCTILEREVVGTQSNGTEAVFREFLDYSTNRQGVDIKVCDCPGLQGSSTDGHFMTTLKEKVNQCDVVIYCVRMDAARLEKMDVENINLISQSLGVDFWDKTVVALTFANLVTSPQTDDSSKESWLNQRALVWKTELRSRLYDAGIPDGVIDVIPLVPVGYRPSSWSIPCDKNWVLSFMLAINGKLSNDSLGMLDVVIRELRRRHEKNSTEIVSWSKNYFGFGVGASFGAGVAMATGLVLAPVGGIGIAAGLLAGALGGAAMIPNVFNKAKDEKEQDGM